MVDGAEVINFDTKTLSYASNLKMDNSTTNPNPQTLYYTAGRRLPNLYTAQFDTNPAVVDKKFWATGVPLPTSAGPFLTFSVLRNNIIGPAFPYNITNVAGFVIQSVYLGSQPSVFEYNTPGLSIVSTLISPTSFDAGNHYVYMAGWDNNTSTNSNFVIARASIKPDQQNPSFELNTPDVLRISLDPMCYDQFDEVVHPQLYLMNTQLIVLVPKRCSFFLRINLPQDPTYSFEQASYNISYPSSAFLNEIYVSSAVFDPLYSTIYYTVKHYNRPGATLLSFNATSWRPNSPYAELDFIEAETILVLGSDIDSDKVSRYIFIIASGANKVQRMTIANNNTFNTLTVAALSPSFNRISSAWYYRPSLYFTTYEPDSKVGRIPKANFCRDWCGDYGYCTNGYCSCRVGYTFDGTDPTNLCVPSSVASEEGKEKASQDEAATLGVLFALSLLAAIAGWTMWWRTRSLHRLPSSYQ